MEILPHTAVSSSTGWSWRKRPAARWDCAVNFERLSALHARWEEAAWGSPRTPENRWAAHAARDELRRYRDHLRSLFAAQRSWQRGKWFTLLQLSEGHARRLLRHIGWQPKPQFGLCAIDHPECYRINQRPYRPAGMIVHVYGPSFDPCYELAADLGIEFEPLAWSWYSPKTLAGVYTNRKHLGHSL